MLLFIVDSMPLDEQHFKVFFGVVSLSLKSIMAKKNYLILWIFAVLKIRLSVSRDNSFLEDSIKKYGLQNAPKKWFSYIDVFFCKYFSKFNQKFNFNLNSTLSPLSTGKIPRNTVIECLNRVSGFNNNYFLNC